MTYRPGDGSRPPGTAAHRPAPQRTARHRSAPPGTAAHRPAPQRTARHRSAPPGTATHRPAPQRTARHRNAPPGTATHRPAPQRTAPKVTGHSAQEESSFRLSAALPAPDGCTIRAAT
ncbi:hypothetical protein GCM10010167_83890 [Paractinoplanes deccanensis]